MNKTIHCDLCFKCIVRRQLLNTIGQRNFVAADSFRLFLIDSSTGQLDHSVLLGNLFQ